MKAWERWPSIAVNPCGDVSVYAAVAREFIEAGQTVLGLEALLHAVRTFRLQLSLAPPTQ